MSLTASPSKIVLSGNGVVTSFAWGGTFAINTTDGSDLTVFVVDNTGLVTQLSTNYTVDVNLKTVNYPTNGGVSPLLTGVNALPAGWYLVIARIEPISQTLVLSNQGVFDAPSIMSALDKIVMILQQQQEQIDRSYKSPINNVIAAADLSSLLAAINGSFPPFSEDTYPNLQLLSAGAPTQRRWGFATDLNNGQGQLCYYTANTARGDLGWIKMPLEYQIPT